MKKILLSNILIIILISNLSAQILSGRISSAVYSFERFESRDVSNKFLRSFQYANFNVSKNKFALRTTLTVEKDLIKNISYDPRIRFYNLYFEGKDIFNLVTIKIGRQPLYHSVASGLFDGLSGEFKYDKFKFTGYYGGNIPAYQKFGLINDWKNNYLIGGKFQFNLMDLYLTLGYLNKNYKSEDYYATRLDENFVPFTVLVKPPSIQYEFFNAELGYSFNKFSFDTRLFYDLNFDKISRFEFNGDFNFVKNLNLNLYYNFREPLIRYNSYFTIFESVVQNSQEIELGANYRINSALNLIGKIGLVKYSDDNSTRLSLGIISSLGVISYKKNFGYAGELDGISLFTNYSLFKGILTPSLGLNYYSYRLSTNDDKNTVLALLLGTNFRPLRILSFDIQGQYLSNKIYKNDLRLFLKINYWFNTNLKVL